MWLIEKGLKQQGTQGFTGEPWIGAL